MKCSHLIIVATLLGSHSILSAAENQKFNVVFIISDDLGAQSLGCYGNSQCKTPNIDALAKRGIRFTRTYCQFPVCGPSRAALMSGMYAQSIGVMGNGMARRFTKNLGKRPSMAQNFLIQGYHTARVSKIYHMRVPGDITAGVNGPDHAPSWNERYNCKAPEWFTEGEHEHLTNNKLKFDRNKHYGLGFGTAFYVVKGSSDGAEQADHIAAAKAIELIDKFKNNDKPFFLAVGLVRPHVPLVAPAKFFTPYPALQMILPKQVEGDWDDIPKRGISKNSKRSGLNTQLKKKKVLQAYYAAVTYMDAQVGKIIRAVEQSGLRKKTIIVFTADHGYHLGEHEFWQKMSLHDESTRIPLIVSVPGKTPAVTPALSQQIDIYPTLSELCGLNIPPHVQGKSLVKAMNTPTHRVHESVYCLRGRNDHLLRTNRWAFIRYRTGDVELYDMQNDPKQFTNLARKKEYTKTVEELQKLLDRKLSNIQQSKSSLISGTHAVRINRR